jgi:transposase
VEDLAMTAIGIDTHKSSLAACAIDELGAVRAEATFPNDPAGHHQLGLWAAAVVPDARIGVEGSSVYGSALSRLLVAAGRDVREVPPHLSRYERVRTRRAGKSDPGDALAIARVTAREADLPPVRIDDLSHDVGLLTEARDDVVADITRTRNRIHADLVRLVPGYEARSANLVAARHRQTAARLLRRVPGVHAELAHDRLRELERLIAKAGALERRLADLVGDHPLLGLKGSGVLVAAKLIGETGDVRRFRSADAFAMLAGVAPIPASSGQTQRLRLNRGGNRQLNRALHSIALSQAWHHPPAKAFIERKRAEGRTWREALRSLKRHLARVVFRLLVAGTARSAPTT